MQKEIDDKLAKALLAGAIHDGDAVRVNVQDDGSGLMVESFEVDTTTNWDGELGAENSDD